MSVQEKCPFRVCRLDVGCGCWFSGSPNAGKLVCSDIMNTWQCSENIWWAWWIKWRIAPSTKACNHLVVCCWMFLQELACRHLDLWPSVLFVWFVSCLCLKCRVFLFYILSSTTHKSLTLTSVCCLSQDYAATGSCFFFRFHPGFRVTNSFVAKNVQPPKMLTSTSKICTVLHPRSSLISIQCHCKSLELP